MKKFSPLMIFWAILLVISIIMFVKSAYEYFDWQRVNETYKKDNGVDFSNPDTLGTYTIEIKNVKDYVSYNNSVSNFGLYTQMMVSTGIILFILYQHAPKN